MHRTANAKTRKNTNISTFFKFLKKNIILIDSSKPTLFFNFEKTVVSCFFHSTTSLFHRFLSLTITVLTRVLCRFVTIIRDHGIGSRGVLNPYTSRSPLLVLFHILVPPCTLTFTTTASHALHISGLIPVRKLILEDVIKYYYRYYYYYYYYWGGC